MKMEVIQGKTQGKTGGIHLAKPLTIGSAASCDIGGMIRKWMASVLVSFWMNMAYLSRA